ncbi:uncharacterized protein KGF55_002710, partial [Candida pseudojiufengensis]|uniref:uncharacterized protein n=1 Tax=Candida pseudojiufengensis TaxID=497109 RepID=UPI0022250878
MLSDLDINSDYDFESDYESDICDREDEPAITTSNPVLQSTHQPTISANSIIHSNLQTRNQSFISTPINDSNFSETNSNNSDAPVCESTILDQPNGPNNSTIIIRNPNQSENTGDKNVLSSETDSDVFGSDSEIPNSIMNRVSTSRETDLNTHQGHENGLSSDSDSDVFGSDSEIPDSVMNRAVNSREEKNLDTHQGHDDGDAQEECEVAEVAEVTEVAQNEDESQVVFLPNGVIYVDGFVVHKNKVVNPYSISFQRDLRPAFREITNRHLTLVKIDDYAESRVIRVQNETLFHYIQPQTYYGKYVKEKFCFSQISSKNAVQMIGVKVFITSSLFALIVIGRPELQMFRYRNKEADPNLVRDNSTLNDYFGGLSISENDRNLIETPYDRNIVDIGKNVYRIFYEKAIGSSEFSGITSRRRFNDHEAVVNFIREHKPETVNNFCHVFGKLLARICLAKEFEMVNKTTHAKELSLIENLGKKSSAVQVSVIGELIRNFGCVR